MLIINDLRIHLPPPPTGTPPSRRRRMLNAIDYQIIIFLINFTVKFEEEFLFLLFYCNICNTHLYQTLNQRVIGIADTVADALQTLYLQHQLSYPF